MLLIGWITVKQGQASASLLQGIPGWHGADGGRASLKRSLTLAVRQNIALNHATQMDLRDP